MVDYGKPWQEVKVTCYWSNAEIDRQSGLEIMVYLDILLTRKILDSQKILTENASTLSGIINMYPIDHSRYAFLKVFSGIPF